MWKLNQEPWKKWLQTKVLFDGEEGGGGGGGGGEPSSSGGEPSGGGEPAGTGGAPTASPTPAAPVAASVAGAPGAPAGVPASQGIDWQEQANFMRQELQRTTAALQQVLRQQQLVPTSTLPGQGARPGDLFNIDEKELANLHPAVQSMFRAMKELHENVGGMKSQFDQTTQANVAAQEAQQLKETETALNNHIDTTLETAGLPKGGTWTNIIGRVAMQSLKNLHSQGYAINRNVIDSVVGDLVTSIKQDMAPKPPPLPPRPGPGGAGAPTLPAVPTAADRKAALSAAISSMNMED